MCDRARDTTGCPPLIEVVVVAIFCDSRNVASRVTDETEFE